MDFIMIQVAIMAKGDKRVMAYSEGDIYKYTAAGYSLIGYETEWV
jgi:hypothetical protein